MFQIPESPVTGIIEELKEFKADVYGHDPLLSKTEIEKFGAKLFNRLNMKADCVIITVPHEEFRKTSLKDIIKITNKKPVLVDVKGIFSSDKLATKKFHYMKL